jgi:hypothetical protein
LNRTFPLHDAFALNLRLEAFNLLNHPNFAAPGASTGSSGYLGTSSAMSSGTFGTIRAPPPCSVAAAPESSRAPDQITF